MYGRGGGSYHGYYNGYDRYGHGHGHGGGGYGHSGGGRGGGGGTRGFGSSFSAAVHEPDWSRVRLEKFERCFYRARTARDPEDVRRFREQHEITVVKSGGVGVPAPVAGFDEAGLPANVLDCFRDSGFKVGKVPRGFC